MEKMSLKIHGLSLRSRSAGEKGCTNLPLVMGSVHSHPDVYSETTKLGKKGEM